MPLKLRKVLIVVAVAGEESILGHQIHLGQALRLVLLQPQGGSLVVGFEATEFLTFGEGGCGRRLFIGGNGDDLRFAFRWPNGIGCGVAERHSQTPLRVVALRFQPLNPLLGAKAIDRRF